MRNAVFSLFFLSFYQFVLSSFFIVSVPFTLSFELTPMSMFIFLLTNNGFVLFSTDKNEITAIQQGKKKERKKIYRNNAHVFPNARGSFETNN